MAKRARRDPGQALRGSSDLHAWTDSACYLARRPDQRLRLTVEHRAAPAPDPLLLSLAHTHGEPLRLQVDGDDTTPPPLAEAVRQALQHSPGAVSRTALRQQLRVNNARLGDALRSLEQRNLIRRTPDGWTLPPPPPHAPQLDLPHRT
ncbi:MAG: hypothetical protein R6T83_00620 [Salinibacter sp.]